MFPQRKWDSTGVKSHWAPMVCFLTLWLHCETQIHSKNYSEFQDKNCKLIKPQSLGVLLSIVHCSGFWALYTAHCSSLHFSLWSKTDQNHLRQKRVYLNHRIKSVIGKGRSRNLKAGNVAETMEECCFLACFPWLDVTCSVMLPLQSRPIHPKMGLPSIVWLFPHQSAVKKVY